MRRLAAWSARCARPRSRTIAASARHRRCSPRSWLPAAVGALGLTLVASVRQRRRELALLKTLGFTQRQLAGSVAWQSSVAAVVGVVVGVPIGVALGRYLWTLFADGISAVPHPTVPGLSIVAVALGALVFANLVALVPGRDRGADTHLAAAARRMSAGLR